MQDILGSILPEFSSTEMLKLQKGLDFIGINYYSGFYAQDCIFSTCQSGEGVTKTEGSYLTSMEKNGVPIGEPVSNRIFSSFLFCLIDQLIEWLLIPCTHTHVNCVCVCVIYIG